MHRETFLAILAHNNKILNQMRNLASVSTIMKLDYNEVVSIRKSDFGWGTFVITTVIVWHSLISVNTTNRAYSLLFLKCMAPLF